MARPLFALLPGVPELFMPRRQTRGAAGHDLRAFIPGNGLRFLKPGETAMLQTGVCAHLLPIHWGAIYGRSSIRKQGVDASVMGGVIDSDYTGELVVVLTNGGSQTLTIRHGDRVAQFVVHMLADLGGAYDLPSAVGERAVGNAGRFGSTGAR